jgi:phosphoglycerate dehydrogenase-like enzyme
VPPSTTWAVAGRRRAGDPPRIALGPSSAPEWVANAIVDAGGHIVAPDDAEALVWTDAKDVAGLTATLDGRDDILWVQLPWAGVEPFLGVIDGERLWTCGKGVYAEPVAELALALGLCGMRHVAQYGRRTSWSEPAGRNLLGANVTILGGGGITESMLRLLQPFDCRVTVVRNRVRAMSGADEVLEAERYVDALPGADLVVLALALTPDTHGLIGRTELELMDTSACLVNVARGQHVVTDDLVDALSSGGISFAGLDVTDPEPLPPGHPLWTLDNCIITPHVGNTPAMAQPLLAERIAANVRRFAEGEPLIGVVDADLGY